MMVCGGVATWNAGFLSQRCLGGVCCKSGRNAVSYSSLDVGFVWK